MIRQLAESADRAISRPAALPAYIVASAVLAAVLPTAARTEVLSHFANLMLVLLAIGQSARAAKMECQLNELARVNPDIDEAKVERDAAP